MKNKNLLKPLSRAQFFNKLANSRPADKKALVHLTQQLHEYEKKYGMRSEIFYKIIVGTPLEDHADFIDWAMCYRAYFRVLQSKFSLKEVLANVA